MDTSFGEIPDRWVGSMSMAEQHAWLHRPLARRSVLRAAALAAAAATAPAIRPLAAGAIDRSPVYGRHVAYGADPATTMTIGFGLSAPQGRVTVRVSAAGGPTDTVPAEVVAVPGAPNRYGRAHLTGLAPDTEYAYRIEPARAPGLEGRFRTARTGAYPFRFTAFGDQATSPDSRALLARVGALDPQLHLVAGDLCYASSSGNGTGPVTAARWDDWLTQNDPVASRVPWMFAVGNHEMEAGFGEHGYAGVLARVAVGGRSPLAVPVASTYRVGSVGFVGLDSNDVSFEITTNRGWTSGAQTAWLASTLRALRADPDVDFIVCYLHHSPYSTNLAHGCEGGVRDAWGPLFDRYGVDLVISGHNHDYERVRPLRAGKVVADAPDVIDSSKATTYVVAGGGGQVDADGFYRLGRTRLHTASGTVDTSAPWALPARTGTHAVLCVDVRPSSRTQPARMRLRAIDEAGRVVDQVVLTRSRETQAVAAPPSSAGDDAPWLIGGLAGAGALVVGAGALAVRHHRSAPADPAP